MLTYVWYAAQPDPIWFTQWFVCDQIGEWNWMEWCSQEYDRLNSRAAVELDNEKRAQMYVRMQELMDEDVIAVWVTNPTYFLAVDKNIKPAMVPTGRILGWAFEKK
jgi:peptide/nickel transport system substrate-binding protein